MPVPPASTYVAIDRTPSESAASGTTFKCSTRGRSSSDASSAVDFYTRPGDHGRVVGGEEHGGVRKILGLLEAAPGDRPDVLAQTFLLPPPLVHEGGQAPRVRRHRRH